MLPSQSLPAGTRSSQEAALLAVMGAMEEAGSSHLGAVGRGRGGTPYGRLVSGRTLRRPSRGVGPSFGVLLGRGVMTVPWETRQVRWWDFSETRFPNGKPGLPLRRSGPPTIVPTAAPAGRFAQRWHTGHPVTVVVVPGEFPHSLHWLFALPHVSVRLVVRNDTGCPSSPVTVLTPDCSARERSRSCQPLLLPAHQNPKPLRVKQDHARVGRLPAIAAITTRSPEFS